MIRYLAGGLLGLCLGSGAFACGGAYTVQAGETLSTIADTLYKDAGRWSAIHAANRDVLGDDPEAVRAGQVLYLDCIDGLPSGLAGASPEADAPETLSAPLDAAVAAGAQEAVTRAAPQGLAVLPGQASEAGPAQVRLLTGGAYRPLIQQGAADGGMLSALMTAALDARLGEGGHATYWQTGYMGLLDTVMGAHAVDVVFPVMQPNCAEAEQTALCADYFYSEPLFEVLELLYVDSARPIAFLEDRDLEGRTLCRPSGHQTHLLAPWLERQSLRLVQPELVSDCIFRLLSGDVDGLVLNEFTAREALAVMGIKTRIVPVETRPLDIASLHAVVRRDHPNAEALLGHVNQGLQMLRADGRYRAIVGRHLDQIWAVQ